MTWLLFTIVMGFQSVLFPAGHATVPKTTTFQSAGSAESVSPPPATLDGSGALDPWG